MNPRTNRTMDSNNSQRGTSKGILIIITTGEVKGIIDNQNANEPFGSLRIALSATIENISGEPILVEEE